MATQKETTSWLDRLRGGPSTIYAGSPASRPQLSSSRLGSSVTNSGVAPYTANASQTRLDKLFSGMPTPLAMTPQGIRGLPSPMSSSVTATYPWYPKTAQSPAPARSNPNVDQSRPASKDDARYAYAGSKGGGVPSPTPAPETPEDASTLAALNRLRLERDAAGSQTTDYGFTQVGLEQEPYDPTTYNPLSIDEIDSLLDRARNKANFLTEREIQNIEDQRKKAIFDIINRESDLEKERRLQEGQRTIRGTEALYTNLGGGPQNITSGTVEQVQQEIDNLDRAIEVLDQQRIDDLTVADTASAQRVEDRINSLFQRKNELESNRLAQIGESESSRQFGATFDENSRQFGMQYGIDAGKLSVAQREAVTNILKLDQTTALDSAKFLVQNFGSMATQGLDLEEIAALETAAKLPFGSLMRELRSIDEQKANQLEFISGSKFQRPGAFNPNTGEFTAIANAVQYIDESGNGALTPEILTSLIEGYDEAPDKDAFISQVSTNIGKPAAAFLLTIPGTASSRNQPNQDTQRRNLISDITVNFSQSQAKGEEPDYETAKKFAQKAGFGDDKIVMDFIESSKPKFWDSFLSAWRGK